MTDPGRDKAAGHDEEATRSGGNSVGTVNADLAAEAAPGDRTPDEDLEKRQDQLLDEAVQETFPASDPIAPKRITK